MDLAATVSVQTDAKTMNAGEKMVRAFVEKNSPVEHAKSVKKDDMVQTANASVHMDVLRYHAAERADCVAV